MEQELEATYRNGARNLISTTIARKFDALTDMEELQIQDLPNNTLIFRFELHFGYTIHLHVTLDITIPLVLRYARPNKRYRTKEI
jgi:hypothetical protein